jgi:putative FmdB family regulatory protein
MPTYEYLCTRCEKQFEILQKITDAPRKRCPDCRGKVIRLISGGGGVLLKGSGFYVTDYRSAEYRKSAEADKPKSSPSEGKDKKKTSNA